MEMLDCISYEDVEKVIKRKREMRTCSL